MTKKQPKQLIHSGYERRERDAYYTESWLTNVLLRHLKVRGKTVCDPAAGRGDILKAVEGSIHQGTGVNTLGYDIQPPRKPVRGVKIIKQDFLDPKFVIPPDVNIVITNPPFGTLAQKFVTKTLATGTVVKAAFLLKSVWNTSPGTKNSRRRLFDGTRPDLIPFAYEIVLTERPTWDWWYVTKAEAEENNKPFHSYSWFVWDRDWKGPSTQFWEGRLPR